MSLAKNEILACQITRIVQSYELLNGSDDYAVNWFVLASGIAFRFPNEGNFEFEAEDLPVEADDVVHPCINAVLGSRIDGIYLAPPDLDYFLDGPDVFRLHVDSGYWLWQHTCAPHGTGYVGLLIEREPPEEPERMANYWR